MTIIWVNENDEHVCPVSRRFGGWHSQTTDRPFEHIHDRPGTVRACPQCGRTWVAYSRSDEGYLFTFWRPERRFEKWRRERRMKKVR